MCILFVYTAVNTGITAFLLAMSLSSSLSAAVCWCMCLSGWRWNKSQPLHTETCNLVRTDLL